MPLAALQPPCKAASGKPLLQLSAPCFVKFARPRGSCPFETESRVAAQRPPAKAVRLNHDLKIQARIAGIGNAFSG